MHGSNTADIPITSGLIEMGSIQEHCSHGSDFSDIPIINGLVEFSSSIKHCSHGSDRTDIPITYVLVEIGSTSKHETHVSDTSDIPAFDRLIKCEFISEQLIHVGDIADIPTVYFTVRINGCRLILDVMFNSSLEIISGSKLASGTHRTGVEGKTTCTSHQAATIQMRETLAL